MKALLIALAVFTAPTDSLPDLSHSWTLQECIDWAMDHNLTVAGSEISLESSKIDENTARMACFTNSIAASCAAPVSPWARQRA